MASKSGLLYVTMHPHESLTEAQFHDWYNNEHGPIRLRLPFVSNGFRYRATDASQEAYSKDKPEWMAIYDITDMSNITTDAYTRLRDPHGVQSQRERDTMKQITVNRKLYDDLDSKQSPDFKKLEAVETEGTNNVMVVVIEKLKNAADKASFESSSKKATEEASKEKGWLRSRRFITSDCEGQKDESEIEYITIHEFSPSSPITSSQIQAIAAASSSLAEQKTRHYELYYTFGPAPRDLASLSSPKVLPKFSSLDFKTKIYSSSETKVPAIESYITTPDGTILPYHLSGSSHPHAPLIVLCNSILVTHEIWAPFLDHFFSNPENLTKYRVLRYNMRGRLCRSKLPSGERVTIDILANDVLSVLDALRVLKAKCVIGVSLGGATTLTLGVRAPFSSRIESFISCDTSMKSPAGNEKAWSDRIAIAEAENLSLPITSPYLLSSPSTQSQEENLKGTVVGGNLASATTHRWFLPPSYENPSLSPLLAEVEEMVKTNDLEGFKESVRALWEYDLAEEVKGARARGLFVVGEGDGVLPKGMKDMAAVYGSGVGRGGKTKCVVIGGAGHLPMVEKPVEFAGVVEGFLG